MVIKTIAKKILKKQNGAIDQAKKARADRNTTKLAKDLLKGKSYTRKELQEMKDVINSVFKEQKTKMNGK